MHHHALCELHDVGRWVFAEQPLVPALALEEGSAHDHGNATPACPQRLKDEGLSEPKRRVGDGPGDRALRLGAKEVPHRESCAVVVDVAALDMNEVFPQGPHHVPAIRCRLPAGVCPGEQAELYKLFAEGPGCPWRGWKV